MGANMSVGRTWYAYLSSFLRKLSALLKDYGGPLVAAAAVSVGLWQYVMTSKRDFIKPLREAQLALYQEASSAAAIIATRPRESEDWKKSRDNFLRLYYGPLAIFEDFDHQSQKNELTVELAMIIFKSCMDDKDRCEKLKGDLMEFSLALAHACRRSLGQSWGQDVKLLHGEYQERALIYWEVVRKARANAANP